MRQIEYFYSAHSAYAYLGSRRLSEICARRGCGLMHRPFMLSPVVEAVGGLSFAARTQPHVDYFFGRELERWSELRRAPIVAHRPTHHDADYALANGVILALGQAGPGVDAMAHAILQAHWRDDADLSDRATLTALIAGQGHDAEAVLTRAGSREIGAQIVANTQEAIQRSVFGSPAYFLGEEMFYGQDHLEMLEHALQTPFAPSRFTNPAVDPRAG